MANELQDIVNDDYQKPEDLAYQGIENVRSIKLLTLRREFENLKTKDSETISEYYSNLLEVVNQMKLYEDLMNDLKVVKKILIGLPKNFDPKVTTIEETHDLSKLSANQLVRALEAYK